MIDNNQVSSPFGFAMPGYWAVPAVPATAVRTDVAVLDGVFPGISAWSPPI